MLVLMENTLWCAGTNGTSFNMGCCETECCGGNTLPPASSKVKGLLGVTPNNQGVLKDPTTKSLCYYDPVTGYVTWQDGSSSLPICLPELQTLSESDTLSFMVGMTTEGCLVKIPITQEQIQTCPIPGGPILTVITTDVE
jgi:hypothetical protein